MKLSKWLLLITLSQLLLSCANPALLLKPPQVTLADLRLQSITLFEQRYTVGLRFQNPNAITLPIRGMQFTLYVNHAELAHGVNRDEMTLPAYGEKVVNIDVVSNLSSLIEQISVLSKNNTARIQYKVVGNVSIAGFSENLPFEYTGEFSQLK